MEQHPVPQNITGFQFKLIGDMTVKQFLLLAGGILSAYVILQLDWSSLVKWPLATIAGGAGFAFAFVPIEERPLDRWLLSFIKSVYAPSQFLWKKVVRSPEVLTFEMPIVPLPAPETLKKEEAAAEIEEYLTSLPSTQAPLSQLDQQETSFLSQVSSSFTLPVPPPASALPVQTPPAAGAGMQAEPPKEDLDQKTEELTSKISGLQQELASQSLTKERFLEIQKTLSSLLKEKESLTLELTELRRKLAQKQEPTFKPTVAAQAPEEPSVKIVAPDIAPKIGMPKIPSLPNTISGLVKTQKGAILPSILVEIRNQEGTPVRALKTGKVGQFAVSTPLINGTYTLHLEDPQGTYHFDIIEMSLNGEIVSPLEIFAKTEKDRVREELSKKLFSKDNF